MYVSMRHQIFHIHIYSVATRSGEPHNALHSSSYYTCIHNQYSVSSLVDEKTCTEGAVRLSGQRVNTNEGLLEVCINGDFGAGYGTVCSLGWDLIDAAVVCKQLGLPAGLCGYERVHTYVALQPTVYIFSALSRNLRRL